MASVTQRIKMVEQPEGGFFPVKLLRKTKIPTDDMLHEKENIHGTLIGLAVDYLTRAEVMSRGLVCADALDERRACTDEAWKQLGEHGKQLSEKEKQTAERMAIYSLAFNISMQGAMRAEREFNHHGSLCKAFELRLQIAGLDDDSIYNACKLVTFDAWLRNPMGAGLAKGADEIEPDQNTIDNIKVMVERSIRFFERSGPVTKIKLKFDPNGYTKIVDCGDGDYLTANRLWDMKVSRGRLTKDHTLQLLMYWIMGQHSGQKIYKGVNGVGIYNPRQSIAYTFDIRALPKGVVSKVEKDVICYEE